MSGTVTGVPERAHVLTHGHVEVPWSNYPAFHAAAARCSFTARCLVDVLERATARDAPAAIDPFGPHLEFRSAVLWTGGPGDTLMLDWVVVGRHQATAALCQVVAGDERRGAAGFGYAALRFYEPGRGWVDRDPVSGRVVPR